MIYSREEIQAIKDEIKLKKGNRCYLHPKYYGTDMTGTQHRTEHNREFDLEHVNNNHKDFNFENLELACHSCNIRKMHEHQKELMELGKQRSTEPKLLFMREGGRESEKGSGKGIDYETAQRMSPEMRKSERFFPVFEKYIIERVRQEKESDYEDLVHSACYTAKVKVKTGREWFKLVSSSVGPVKVIRNQENEPEKVVLRVEPKDSIGKVRV
jgi:hypothetical protein